MNALDWLAEQRLKVKRVEKLAGLTACSRLIELENRQKFVWREQNQRADDYGVDYRQEAALLQGLAFLPFTPKPYVAIGNFSLLHWQAGEVPTQWSESLLHKLATRLAALHSLDLQAVGFPQKIATLNLAARCQSLWEKLSPVQQAKLNFAPPFEPITPFMQAICHHDIHLGNLVEHHAQLYLIDWEYAAISDPALDLALFLSANDLTDTEQTVFFERYFAKFPANRTACLAKMCEYQPLVEKLSRLWYAIGER